ncbi:Phosphorylated carbohydrates phosphatase [Hordeum vulgare]|nr:Phosphorylated carbohydrates phosphatase [Hordeum vulgare]
MSSMPHGLLLPQMGSDGRLGSSRQLAGTHRSRRRAPPIVRDNGQWRGRRRKNMAPSGFSAKPDEDELLLALIYPRSLTSAQTNARRLRRKNAKALRLAIKQSEREPKEKATEAPRLEKLKRQQGLAVRWLKWLIVLSSFSDDHIALSDDSNDPP